MAFLQLKNCLSDPKQIIKLFVLIVCICFSVNQVTECINKLTHPPVSTYYKFHLNKSVNYPSLTICRKPAYKTSLFKKYGVESNILYTERAFSEFKFDQFTIEQFLEETTYSAPEMYVLYGFGGSPFDTLLNISAKYFINKGRCIIVTPTTDTDQFSEEGGYFFNLKNDKVSQDIDKLTGFDIYLHKPNEVLDDSLKNSFMEHILINTDEDITVNLNVQIFKQVSTSDEPCITDQEYSKSKCEEKCIHSQAAKQAGCTLPWLTDNEFYPQCNTPQSVKKLIHGFNEKNRSSFLEMCDCSLIGCDISIYKSTIQSKKENSGTTKIQMYYASNLITQMEEVLGYDGNNFLSDFGGSMGFLLGLSVIGIIEIGEEIIDLIMCVKRKFSKKKNISEDSSSFEAGSIADRTKRNVEIDKVFDYLNKSEASTDENTVNYEELAKY